jgi:hypothetical protein
LIEALREHEGHRGSAQYLKSYIAEHYPTVSEGVMKNALKHAMEKGLTDGDFAHVKGHKNSIQLAKARPFVIFLSLICLMW